MQFNNGSYKEYNFTDIVVRVRDSADEKGSETKEVSLADYFEKSIRSRGWNKLESFGRICEKDPDNKRYNDDNRLIIFRAGGDCITIRESWKDIVFSGGENAVAELNVALDIFGAWKKYHAGDIVWYDRPNGERCRGRISVIDKLIPYVDFVTKDGTEFKVLVMGHETYLTKRKVVSCLNRLFERFYENETARQTRWYYKVHKSRRS